jgi:hypothetical protein
MALSHPQTRPTSPATSSCRSSPFGVEPPGGPVDATPSADPVAFLMLGSGRRYEAVALGGLTAGGARPDLAFDFPTLFVYP